LEENKSLRSLSVESGDGVLEGGVVKRWVEATILSVECASCRAISAHLIFSGDTDMATDGLLCLTSIRNNELVVAEAEGQELADPTGSGFARRVNGALGRDDLRFIRLIEVVQNTATSGQSFQAFRETYQPPRLRFSCPRCGSGSADVVREMSPKQFLLEGGRITTLDDVGVRG
jgi:hypothetical protein